MPLVSGGTISSSSAVVFEPKFKPTFGGYPPIRTVLCRGMRSPGGGQPSDMKPGGSWTAPSWIKTDHVPHKSPEKMDHGGLEGIGPVPTKAVRRGISFASGIVRGPQACASLPLSLSPAPLRSVQEPGRVQERPGALRCGRPLVQSPPCTHQTWHAPTNLWGTVDSLTCPSGCKELCEHATWPPVDEWDVQPTSGGSRNSDLLHQVVHDSRGWTSSVNMLLESGSTHRLWVRPAIRHRLQGRRR